MKRQTRLLKIRPYNRKCPNIQGQQKLFSRALNTEHRGLLGINVINRSETGIHMRLGKVKGSKSQGLNFYIPIIDKIIPVSNRVHQDEFQFEVMTDESTFVVLDIAVQYKIEEEDTERALFELDEPEEQMRSFVENVIRAQVPNKKLKELFKEQEEISRHIEEALADGMKKYGFTIVKTLIRRIEPEKSVKTAMNAVIASAKMRDAAKNEGEAKRIKMVEEAIGDSERKRLQGEGISKQRLAILKGYEKGVEDMALKLGLTSKDIIAFVMKTQELDTWESIGRGNGTKTIFLSPHSEKGMSKQIMEALES